MTEPLSLLRRYEVFRSDNLDYVREEVGRIFCPHELGLYGRGSRLDARMRSKRLRDITINLVSYGGDVSIEPGLLDDFYVIMIPLRGSANVRCGTEEIDSHPGLATVPNPDRPLRMRWTADCVQLIMRIDRAALEACLRDELGRPLDEGALDFQMGMNVTSGLASSWRRVALMITRELDEEENIIDCKPSIRGWENALMVNLLRAQPHNYDLGVDGKARALARPEVNSALRLLKDNPEDDWTVTRLARRLGVGPRKLQQGLQEIGTTFTHELRSARLHRVHNMLYAAAPGTTTVSKAFAQNGITHHGHGAAQYRDLFGERPSDTLRR